MISKNQIPNMVTILNIFVASVSLISIFRGYFELSIRLIFLCLSLDVLDGLLARKLNAMSEEGELLDRVTDRIYQVIAPALLYASLSSWSLISEVYVSTSITVAFWRLIRKVPAKDRFIGLPLFSHTFIIIFGYLSEHLIPAWFMMIMVVLSTLPIPYFRKLGKGGPTETRGTLWQIRILIPLILSFSPYQPLKLFFLLSEVLLLVYILFGWLPFMKELTHKFI
ncbi:MAG: CDP-alcohol phosphatidyltransferase family protein [Fervidicoccaceae archaeon]